MGKFISQEMSDYRAALNTLRTNNTWLANANHHSQHWATNIHTLIQGSNGEQFLPWHRYFLIEMEWYMRNTSTNAGYLSIPYWAWRTDRSSTASIHWHQQFLSLANLSNFILSSRSSQFATAVLVRPQFEIPPFW